MPSLLQPPALNCKRSRLHLCLLLTALTIISLSSGQLMAGETTDVVDAFDDLNADPFDVHIEPSFRQHIEQGTITREANCTPDLDGPAGALELAQECPDEATIVRTRELDYERVVNAMDLQLEIGLFRDLEFHLNLPFVMNDITHLDFSVDDSGNAVSAETSAIDPSSTSIQQDINNGDLFSTYQFFDVGSQGYRSPQRSGFGDMSLGLSWSPFNQDRRAYSATLTFDLDYIIPTGKIARPNNTFVGRGLHEFHLDIAASRRLQFLEPYIQFGYVLPIPASDSPFVDYGGGQSNIGPGQSASISMGTELVLFEKPATEQRYSIELGFLFDFTSEGRDYTVLTDALSGSSCNGVTPSQVAVEGTAGYRPPTTISPDSAACAWIVQQPSNESVNPLYAAGDTRYLTDGITTVEPHASIGGRFGLNLQFSRFVSFRINADMATQTEHFLTAARTGIDKDGDDEVDFDNIDERNPLYNPTLDGVGRRLKAESVFLVDWNMIIAFQF